jgi:8-oxo-dGTP pyrophosphatase MutT (NUDIX family)
VRRDSARVLLVDARDKLLLFRFLNQPGRPELGTVWLTPGGGMKDGEQPAEAAARELFEETGLSVTPDALGPMVAFTSGSADLGWMAGEFYDAFFFHRVAHHDVDTRGFEELEASTFVESRWWSAPELAQKTETVIPNGLPGLLNDLLAGKRPAEPVRLPWHH